jgi:hypothetical protein
MPLEVKDSRTYGRGEYCKCECHNIDKNTHVFHLENCCIICPKCQDRIAKNFNEHYMNCYGKDDENDKNMEAIIRLNIGRR